MKPKNILAVIAVGIVVIILLYSFQGGTDEASYRDRIISEREETDRFMRTSPQSPFAQSRESFAGLRYFEPDLKYRIVADLEPVRDKKMVVLSTSDGKQERYVEYAYAEFRLDGVSNRLLILESIGAGPAKGKLFLAFGDKTSAGETYGAGRYLDLEKVPGSATVTLDFNKAYNPYCAYNDTFSCPLPPPGNLLDVAIRAGEKNYH